MVPYSYNESQEERTRTKKKNLRVETFVRRVCVFKIGMLKLNFKNCIQHNNYSKTYHQIE